jgi:hypothetical protein
MENRGIYSYMENNKYSKLNEPLTKMVNTVVNSYLKKHTDTDVVYNFTVRVRKAYNEPFVGYNAGSHGEPYNYVIEIDSDIPFPESFKYKEEIKKTTYSSGFDNSLIKYEIKQFLPYMGIDSSSFGNVFGISFTNLQ